MVGMPGQDKDGVRGRYAGELAQRWNLCCPRISTATMESVPW
jgi:hypothetical protein